MDKLKLAHEFSMKLVGNPTTPLKDMDSIIAASWQYADAMQAEAEKREPKGLPEALREEWQPDWSQAPDVATH